MQVNDKEAKHMKYVLGGMYKHSRHLVIVKSSHIILNYAKHIISPP
jgi:hypothetical protein